MLWINGSGLYTLVVGLFEALEYTEPDGTRFAFDPNFVQTSRINQNRFPNFGSSYYI